MIREAMLTDLGALTEVESSCFGSDAWSPGLVGTELAGENRSVLLACEGTEVHGYGSIAVVDDVADLQRIAIVPDSQGQGMGRDLLRELLAKATGLGATRALLEVAASNEPAIGLYESFGFTPIDRRRAYYADGTDAIVMEWVLGESA